MKGSLGMYVSIILVIALAAGLLLFGDNKHNAVDIMEGETDIVEEVEGEAMTDTVLLDGIYLISTKDSNLIWTGRKKIGGLNHSANVPLNEGQIVIKDGMIEQADITIAVASLSLVDGDIGGDRFFSHVTSSDFLSIEEFPTANLMIALDSVSKVNETMVAKGKLTLKGETKEISIPFTTSKDDSGRMVVVGTVDIDRTEWGIRFGSDRFFDNLGDAVIDDIVTVSFTVVADIDSGGAEIGEGDSNSGISL